MIRLLTGSLLVLLCLFLSGCKEEDTPSGIIFDHELHLGRGFDCGLCHQFLSDFEPTRPAERVCAFCHEIGDHDDPDLDCAMCHSRVDFTSKGLPRPTYQDTKFIHETHIRADVACESCHKGQSKAETYHDIVFPKMKDCIECHQKSAVNSDCETCHQVLGKDTKPASHDHLWLVNHGPIARNTFDTNCSICHTDKAFCENCHLADPPQNHTLFFKNRGHGFQASTDRMECQPCHLQDFCLECHGPGSNVMPVSHKGGFGGRKPYLHCAGCHFPEGKINGCSACHNAATIAMRHREATAQLSDPIPSFVQATGVLNCLNACHPFQRNPILHPIGILNNNDCLRCHAFE